MALSAFTVLCDHHHPPPPERFHHSQVKLSPVNSKPIPILPGNHHSTLCLYGLTTLGTPCK